MDTLLKPQDCVMPCRARLEKFHWLLAYTFDLGRVILGRVIKYCILTVGTSSNLARSGTPTAIALPDPRSGMYMFNKMCRLCCHWCILATALQPMSRLQKPLGQSIMSTACRTTHPQFSAVLHLITWPQGAANDAMHMVLNCTSIHSTDLVGLFLRLFHISSYCSHTQHPAASGCHLTSIVA